jgi:hypothetical protein
MIFTWLDRARHAEPLSENAMKQLALAAGSGFERLRFRSLSLQIGKLNDSGGRLFDLP